MILVHSQYCANGVETQKQDRSVVEISCRIMNLEYGALIQQNTMVKELKTETMVCIKVANNIRSLAYEISITMVQLEFIAMHCHPANWA